MAHVLSLFAGFAVLTIILMVAHVGARWVEDFYNDHQPHDWDTDEFLVWPTAPQPDERGEVA